MLLADLVLLVGYLGTTIFKFSMMVRKFILMVLANSVLMIRKLCVVLGGLNIIGIQLRCAASRLSRSGGNLGVMVDIHQCRQLRRDTSRTL
jgi:hypothetical protein